MGEEKRARAGETAESPRKAPRLDMPAAAAADSGCDDVAPLEVSDLSEEAAAATSDTDSERCGHMFFCLDEVVEVFAQIESSKDAPTCEHYLCGVTGWTSILVCMECNSYHCTGVAAEDKPQGHARWHAENDGHWFALWCNDPCLGYCFVCERNMHHGVKNREDVGEMAADDDAGGYASGLADGHGYVVRGMPNLGNTCYLNALVQCLLVLGKLRARMLGPDAPTGLLGTLLVDFFVATNGVNDARHLLDPSQLLQCIHLGDSRFIGNSMQDSHELLLYLRSALDEEEKLKEPPDMQEGAPSAVVPTVTDSIFRGQMCVTTTCKCCSINSVSHDVFYDLSVPPPSKRPPAKSVASPPRNKRCRSQGKIRIKLFPAINKSNMEKIQTIAEGSDSQIPGSELEDVVMEKTPKPLEVDSTEAEQIWQIKDAVHGPLQAQKDDVPGEIIGGTLKAVDFPPHNVLFDVKVQGLDETTADSYSPGDIGPPPLVSPLREKNAQMASGSDVKQNDNEPEASIEVKENTYSVEVTTEDKGKAQSSDIVYDEGEDISSLGSIEECLALQFNEEVIERHCENCSNVSELPSTNTSKDGEQVMASTNENTTVAGDQTERSDRKTCQNEQSSDLNSLAVECTSSSRQPHGSIAQHQVILAADITSKGITSGMSCGEKDSASCSTANKKPECPEGVQEAVPSCLPAEKQTNLLSAQDSQNASTLNQGRGKQVKLDHSAHQVEENQNEQEDRSGGAIQTRLFSKLPPVLVIHLKRSVGLLKVNGHVSFKEILDVGPFMDPSSEDKDNFSYRLVGVIEHRGGLSADVGHYVAYVRPSHQQQSSGSSSWFCASDANIREVSLEEVLKCEAYILFYERMEG